MKRLLSIALLALSSIAFGATLNPVQLLNPTGSSSGQAIVSTGASSAPAWANVTVSGVTGAAPIASPTFTGIVTIPSGAVIAGYAPLASPTFTGTVGAAAITATGAITPSQTVGIVGTTTNNDANAGAWGEYPNPCSTTGTSMTSNTPITLASCSLTAGDWDVWAIVQTAPDGTTTTTQISAGVSTTTNVFQSVVGTTIANEQTIYPSAPAGQVMVLSSPQTRLKFASTTTVFCVGRASFSVSTMQGGCAIQARRRR